MSSLYQSLFVETTIPESADPFALFSDWFNQAEKTELNDHNAMILATVGADGLPNARVVLLKGVTPQGFIFYTNCNSAKGNELERHPKAALNFHWKSLEKQIRIRGGISVVASEVADHYFASRSRGSKIGAWASKQSSPLTNRSELIARYKELEQQFNDDTIKRPEYWRGYLLEPLAIEFWQQAPFRLHDRLIYRRSDYKAAWQSQRLYP